MLILTRKAGEALKIGDDITVTVLGVNGSQIRIGIDAPKSVAVDREEIAVRKAGGEPAPKPKRQQASEAPSAEPLYGNRTEQEWRELLAAEQKAQEARA